MNADFILYVNIELKNEYKILNFKIFNANGEEVFSKFLRVGVAQEFNEGVIEVWSREFMTNLPKTATVLTTNEDKIVIKMYEPVNPRDFKGKKFKIVSSIEDSKTIAEGIVLNGTNSPTLLHNEIYSCLFMYHVSW